MLLMQLLFKLDIICMFAKASSWPSCLWMLSRDLVSVVLALLMHCLLYLCAFIHMHYCTSFRYDRWTIRRTCYWSRTRKRCWWTYPEEAKNQEYMLGPEYSPSECHLTNTDLVLIPGKPRCITHYFKLWIIICVLLVHYVVRSCLEP